MPGGLPLVDFATKTGGSENEVALMIALGAVTFREEQKSKNTDLEALLFSKTWTERKFDRFFADLQAHGFDNYSSVTSPEIFSTVTAGKILYRTGSNVSVKYRSKR